MFCYFTISYKSQHHRSHPNVIIKQTELRQFVASGDFFRWVSTFVPWRLHGTWNHTKNYFPTQLNIWIIWVLLVYNYHSELPILYPKYIRLVAIDITFSVTLCEWKHRMWFNYYKSRVGIMKSIKAYWYRIRRDEYSLLA